MKMGTSMKPRESKSDIPPPLRVLLLHDLHGKLGTEERSGDVHAHDLLEVIEGKVFQRGLERRHAGVLLCQRECEFRESGPTDSSRAMDWTRLRSLGARSWSSFLLSRPTLKSKSRRPNRESISPMPHSVHEHEHEHEHDRPGRSARCGLRDGFC
jgi:hypothetical protein